MNSQTKIRLLLFIGAVLTGFTLVFPAIGFLQWISMVPIFLGAFWMCKEPSVRLWRAYRFGFFTVFCYYFVLYHWFINLYPLDFVGLGSGASIAVIAAAWVGLSILQAIAGGFLFLLFALFHRVGAFEKNIFFKPLVFSTLWVIFEWTSSLSWVGVPWGRLLLGQINNLTLLQSSALFGSYFVSFLILFINGLTALAILHPSKRGLALAMAAFIFFSNLLFGVVWKMKPIQTENTVKIAVIQGNVNSHDKWDSSSYSNVKNIHKELTEQAAAEGAEIVVWAETALPYILNWNGTLEAYCSDIAKNCGITLIVGALYEDEDDGEYNSLYLIDKEGNFSETRYDKRHLVPFGEYVPMRDLIMTFIPPLAEVSALDSDLLPGTSTSIFEVDGAKIGSLICFDSIYEQLTLDSVNDGAEVMILSTNDSWFYDSAAVDMHKAQAQIRAIEVGRFFARSANTGISAIINSNGECLEEIAALEKGYAVAEVSLTGEKTLYSVIGNTFVYLCIAFLTVLFLMAVGTKIKRKNLLWKKA